jgi:hypothetical protein
VFDTSALIEKIPDQFKPMAALGIGALMLVFLVLVHGAGLHGILVFRAHRERHLRAGRPRVVAAMVLFGSSVFLMLSLHIVEFMLWAYALISMGLIAHASDALYFCANAYTTLGYGNVDLGQHWRNIAPIMGISGLFTFAWTTSALVGVVASHRQLIEQLLEEREQEMRLRFTLGKDEWNALKKARAAALAEKEKTRTQFAGTSFFQRARLWKEDKKTDAEICESAVAEVEGFRRKERQDEDRLGPDVPLKDPGDKK